MGLCVLVALTTAACAKPDDPGVGVDPIAADVVFGIKDVDPAAPANSPSVDITPEEATSDDLLDESFFFDQPTTRNFPRPQPVKVECPAAAIDEFPDEPAPETVPLGRLPKEGIYRWKRSGEQVINDFKTAIGGFEQRIVKSVTVIQEVDNKTNDANDRVRYTFQTVQPELATGLVVTTDWYVDSNPVADTEANNTSPAVRANVGEPERGLVIRRIERQSSSGDRIRGGVTQFAPGAGLLVLPLRIRVGEKWSSVAVDTQSGREIRLDGQVRDRERVDACGEILDGWKVVATLRGESTARRTYEFIVAPQFGALLTMEKWEGETPSGTASVTYTIGQKEPTPLPANEEDKK